MSEYDTKPEHHAGTGYVAGHGKYRFQHPTGTGFRPSFHALWHLDILKVVEDLRDFDSPPWQAAQKFVDDGNRPMRVAIIDTPVDWRHPNLRHCVDLGLMRDFSRDASGLFAVLDGRDRLTDADRKAREEVAQRADNQSSPLADALRHEIDWIAAVEKAGEYEQLRSREVKMFGAHGTAVAGLIGARPTIIKLRKPAYFPPKPVKTKTHKEPFDPSVTEDIELPYSGINPFCSIVPVCVSAVPSPEMLLAAVQYAALVQPDVVVIADSWDRPEGENVPQPWTELEYAFMTLCRSTMVFCAAGNEALTTVVYPASRCTEDDGPWAVGACDEFGKDLGYSPDLGAVTGHGGWMIKTLSTELPRFDRDPGGVKTDPWQIIDKDLGSPPILKDYPSLDIITTDLPGRAGYNPSIYEHDPGEGDIAEHYEIASLFSRFAGTSASAAIAGGLVSLIPRDEIVEFDRAGKNPADPEYKLNRLFDNGAAGDLFRRKKAARRKRKAAEKPHE